MVYSVKLKGTFSIYYFNYEDRRWLSHCPIRYKYELSLPYEIASFKMTKLILILFLSCCQFLSCKEQTKIVTLDESTIRRSKTGTYVSEIYHQIWNVYQDRKGHYWFGSNGNGLYYYDEQSLTLFTTHDGLTDNSIRSIQEDNQGYIYIETPYGVSKYDGTSFVPLDIISSSDNQWKLEPDDLWFNCNGNANHVYRYDGINLYELALPKQNIRDSLGIHEDGLSYSPYTVFGIDKDKEGHLWLGTVIAGAFRYDGESFLWIGDKEISRLPDGREPGVRSMLQDRDGYMWLSNFKSKYAIDANSPNRYTKLKAIDIPDHIVRDKLLYFNSGLTDSEGNLWMTTYGGGVWKYDGQTLSNTEIKNEHQKVLLISIYQDNKGTIWLGTNNDGVYRQSGDGFEKFEPQGINAN